MTLLEDAAQVGTGGGDSLEIATVLGKLGLAGVVIYVLGKVVIKLWSSGREDLRKVADEAKAERDRLLEERTAMRLAHAGEDARLRAEYEGRIKVLEVTHATELANVVRERLGEREREGEKRDTSDEKLVAVLQGIAVTLGKIEDRIRT